MPADCPVCRERVPWNRTFFTSAWGSWRCSGCESLLAIDVRRRLLAIALAVAVLFAVTRVVRVPPSLDLPFVLFVMFGVMTPYFLFLERIRVLERRGFRCRECGYDLQGQLDPRCPECGLEFSEAETPRIERAGLACDSRRPAHRRRHAWAITAVVVGVFLATVAGVGLLAYTTSVRRAAAPDVKRISDALLAFAATHNARPPTHAIGLALDGLVVSSDFVSFDSLSTAESVPVDRITLAQFVGLSPERKKAVAEAAVQRVPRGTIGHRLGDFVFTYHGIVFGNADPGLWVVVWSPDPAQNPRPGPRELVSIGLAGGGILQVPLQALPDRLRLQNELRAKYGLGALADPLAVTHAKPMMAKR